MMVHGHLKRQDQQHYPGIMKTLTTTMEHVKKKKCYHDSSTNDNDFPSKTDQESSPGSSNSSGIYSSPSASPFASDRFSCSSSHSLSDENSTSNILVTTVNNFCQQMETFNGSLVDFPCLASDEIDRLLGSVNDFENFQLHPPTNVTLSNVDTRRNETKFLRHILQPDPVTSGAFNEEFDYNPFDENDSEEMLLTNEIISSNSNNSGVDLRSNNFPHTSRAKRELINYDSESTITGSETEMYQAELARKRSDVRKRYSKRIPKKPKYLEDSLDLSESEDEETRRSQHGTSSLIFGICSKLSRNSKEKINEMDHEVQEQPDPPINESTHKPWWPKIFFREEKDDTESSTESTENHIAETRMMMNLRRLHKRRSHEEEAGLIAIMKNEHKFLTFVSKIWRKRRQRKQLELWQFILKKLDAQIPKSGSSTVFALHQQQQQSPFKWVDRNAGVFRINDTRLAAEEWGRYRNNSRMDYEKMARAMRFYYKHSILRKARQQLHFQFAMPFVEWFNLHQYLLKGRDS